MYYCCPTGGSGSTQHHSGKCREFHYSIRNSLFFLTVVLVPEIDREYLEVVAVEPVPEKDRKYVAGK